MSRNSNTILFVTNNFEWENRSNPPMISNTGHKYLGYFEDIEGKQYVYVHDYPTKTSWIQCGEKDWEKRWVVSEDLDCDLFSSMTKDTMFWVGTAYAASHKVDLTDVIKKLKMQIDPDWVTA